MSGNLESLDTRPTGYAVRVTVRVFTDSFQIQCDCCNLILYSRFYRMAGPGIHEAVGMVTEAHFDDCKANGLVSYDGDASTTSSV